MAIFAIEFDPSAGCLFCPFWDQQNKHSDPLEVISVCRMTGFAVDSNSTERDEDCPLVDISEKLRHCSICMPVKE